MMEIAYYPGCALHGSSDDYEQSVRACLKLLGAELHELNNWICCGATAAHSLNSMLSLALPARNLGIAERDRQKEVLAPCPMCSMELWKAKRALQDDRKLRERVSEIVELEVSGATGILNLIQVFQRIGASRIRGLVKRELTHISAACYYGCLLTRPAETVAFDDPEHPHSMEDLLETLGARSVAWGHATECCGAGMTLCCEETVLGLSHKILTNAAEHGANCIVLACPMCHMNLDMKQEDVEKRFGVQHHLPIYYLSDLVGLALGLDEATLGINRHFVQGAPAQ